MAKGETAVDSSGAIDMTKAVKFGPLPTKTAYLLKMTKWDPTKRTDKGRKVDWVAEILEPSTVMETDPDSGVEKEVKTAGKKLMESVSLENEYTLGAYQSLLEALGFPESVTHAAAHVPPSEDEVIGLQFCGWVKTQKSEGYADKSVLRRSATVATYKELGGY